jgi:uncharacterized protein YggT (Ycf19 family)
VTTLLNIYVAIVFVFSVVSWFTYEPELDSDFYVRNSIAIALLWPLLFVVLVIMMFYLFVSLVVTKGENK